MKKILIPLIVIVALGAYFALRHEEPAADSTTTTVGAGYHPDASHATFIIEGEAVTLAQGEAETTDESIGSVTETKLLQNEAYGDLNGDGKEDTVVLLSQSGGGSGTFIYAAAYVSGPVGYKGTEAVFIGDRIAPTSLSIAQGVATVSYLDRKPDDPMSAEPTVPTSKHFVYRNGEFAEE
jgi:hypothetical protein